MSKLADLKAKVVAELATVSPNMTAYVSGLESKVKLNAGWIIGGFFAGLVIGWFIGHYL